MQPIIQLENVFKRFTYFSDRPNSLKTLLVSAMRGRFSLGARQTIEVLQQIDLSIYPGEFVGIMGRNGVGKSTILKIMCGIYHPSEGKVSVRGIIAPLIELGAGFHGELSGYENIFLNAAVLGFGRKVTNQAVKPIIEFSELGDKIHMPIKKYSSGMLVRLGFSIAVHLDAQVLLVDEVLAVGDTGFQKKCLEKIHELHQSGKTIILVTHNPEAVKRHCSRCVLFNNQRKVFDGTAEKGVQEYLALNG